ncbi:MAG: hypothetical protein WCI45_14240 [Desulfuromonadales bacterium]
MLLQSLHMGLFTVIIPVRGITRLTGLLIADRKTYGGRQGGVAPSFSR